MNLKAVAAYIYSKKESDVKWAKHDKSNPKIIYGRFADGLYFRITGKYADVPDEVT